MTRPNPWQEPAVDRGGPFLAAEDSSLPGCSVPALRHILPRCRSVR